MNCPHCNSAIFSLSKDGERLKALTTVIVLHKSGVVEINCPRCKNGVILPLVKSDKVELRKGRVQQRFVFRRGA